MRYVYLDYAATTPVDPRVIEKMLPFFREHYGNPSSVHALGKMAKDAIESARYDVGQLIHAEASEVIFTSGATEANNLALKGAASLYQSKGKHIITLKTEHLSVLDTCRELEKQGFAVTYLTPEKNGILSIEKFEAALRKDTMLVSLMHVNNETGVIQDIEKIANITSQRGILFHTDATQSVGKIALDVTKIPVDLLSFSGHKIYGPKGIGALYLRRKPRVHVAAQLHGGGQERGIRSGTLPTHQIVGLGEACRILKNERAELEQHLQICREKFLKGLHSISFKVNGDIEKCFPGILSISFEHWKARDLVERLKTLAFGIGSACLSKGTEPSHVLKALGLADSQCANTIRVSFGRFTTLDEIDFAIDQFTARG